MSIWKLPAMMKRSERYLDINVWPGIRPLYGILGNLPIGKTKVIFTAEVRSSEHLGEILSDLELKGFVVKK